MDKLQIGRASDKFMIRLPDGLRGRIKEAAQNNRRSANAEIVLVLEKQFGSQGPAAGGDQA